MGGEDLAVALYDPSILQSLKGWKFWAAILAILIIIAGLALYFKFKV